MKKYIWRCLWFMSVVYADSYRYHLGPEWYPSRPQAIANFLKKLDADAEKLYDAYVDPTRVRVAIVPHAAWKYSGAVAAGVYRLLAGAKHIKNVLILAPDHRQSFEGLGTIDAESYQLPHGAIPINQGIVAELLRNGIAHVQKKAFDREHALEIQLPFLMKYMPQVSIIPLLVGRIGVGAEQDYAEALVPYLKPDTLLLISTDFVHYGERYQYEPFDDHQQLRTRQLDSHAVWLLEQGTTSQFNRFIQNTGATICGTSVLKILLALKENWLLQYIESRLISYDTSGKKDDDNSVSYVGLMYTQEKLEEQPFWTRFTMQEQRGLLQQAYDTLRHFNDIGYSAALYEPLRSLGVSQRNGAFATLRTKPHKLRGCIGRITTNEPLYKTIPEIVNDAASRDRRFAPISAAEVPSISISLSILSEPKAVSSYRDIVLGDHGIILKQDAHAALFLPEVPMEFDWTREKTLQELSEKAGLPADAWRDPKTTYKIFTTFSISNIKGVS